MRTDATRIPVNTMTAAKATLAAPRVMCVRRCPFAIRNACTGRSKNQRKKDQPWR
jgi:hypothetical protein